MQASDFTGRADWNRICVLTFFNPPINEVGHSCNFSLRTYISVHGVNQS